MFLLLERWQNESPKQERPQAPSLKLQARATLYRIDTRCSVRQFVLLTEATSAKLEAPSNKHQAPSSRLQAPRTTVQFRIVLNFFFKNFFNIFP